MKTVEPIKAEIDKLFQGDTMQGETATVQENAPLALMQTECEGKILALKWVLKD